MRTYVVQPGDSPASIAARDAMAGCPKCAIELPRVNAHKPAVILPNGFVTFEGLAAGETLNLPDTWFHPAREQLPPAYYRILPHPNGVTRGSLGGALGDFPELDAAVSAVAQLAAADDGAFAQGAGDASVKVVKAVQEVDAAKSPDAAAKAKLVRDGAAWAIARNRDLAAAVAASDSAAAVRARLDVQNALATALGNARLAIVAYYPAQAQTAASTELTAAARAAAAAIAADPNYCTSVIHPGSPVNSAVHRFKLAWNASQSPKVPVGTGTYEVATTIALGQVLGQAPSACGAGQRPVPAPKPPPPLTPKEQEALTSTPTRGWSRSAVAAGVAVLAAAAGGVAYLATRESASASRGQSPASRATWRPRYAP
jgi:hypothetical protein